MSDRNYKKIGLYSFVSIFTLILVGLSLDFEKYNLIENIMILILGILLTQWYLFVGLIFPRSSNEPSIFKRREDGKLLKPVLIYTKPVALALLLIVLEYLINDNFEFVDGLVIALYVIGPTIILLWRHWISTFVSILWVWFPIEWNLLGDHMVLRFELLPSDALIGLFALLWPMIMLGRHRVWYDWALKKSDFKYVNYATLAATVAVVPLGIALNFLRINFDQFTEAGFPDAVGLALLVFFGIFIVQGLMEELLFRDFIFRRWGEKLKEISNKRLEVLSIIFGGLLIISIPFWGPFLRLVADLIPLPIFDDIANRVGDLDRPLGHYEGAAIDAFVDTPLWIFYLGVGVLLMTIGLLLYKKYPDPMFAALLASSMIFGFAHFQDWRYVMFASFAGMGYGYAYYRTKNLVAAALVHMGVDAVWSLILSY